MNKIRIVTLIRNKSTDEGTPGVLCTDNGFLFRTIELPDNNNAINISCIPTGTYNCKTWTSHSRGKVIRLISPPDRTNVLIHVGNWAGDVSKGYRSDSKGCILIGDRFMQIHNQKAVRRSKTSLKRFIDIMGNDPFKLVIEEF